ncbi:MAG: reverse transcriptase family protein [Firmicutes bacterium]|nr:reverse transcriptase family protein [Bacillota bacterium]
MKIIEIRKGSKVRTIYAPGTEEKAKYRAAVGVLNDKAMKVCDPDVVHGFMPGRSPVTNALRHVGYAYTVSFDLKDFFDTVTPDKVSRLLTKEQKELVFVDGAARQGLPTSPAVANLAASDMDAAILKWVKKSVKQIVYTRYADDLSFSFNDPEIIGRLKSKIPEIVRRCGFKVNEAKTQVQAAVAGRRIICGVAVDGEGIHPTRSVKRRLRAALHQAGKGSPEAAKSAKGLAEWCKLKLPQNPEEKRAKLDEQRKYAALDALRRLWKLRKIDLAGAVAEKVIPEQDLGDNCYITNDPAYFMGMSTFTTGWTSCMKQNGGEYRKGVMAWLALPGTSVAVFLSSNTMTVHGVTRRKMRARCLVHKLEDGRMAYDKLYGNPEDRLVLAGKLEAAEMIPVERIPRGHKIVGHIPVNMSRPYLDNLRAIKTIKSGKSVIRFAV